MALDEKSSLGRGWKRGGWREGGRGGYPSYPGELDHSGDLTSLSDFADELPTSKKKDLVIHVICFGDFKALKGEGELGRRNLGTRGRKENSSRNLNDEFKIQTMNFGGDRTPYE